MDIWCVGLPNGLLPTLLNSLALGKIWPRSVLHLILHKVLLERVLKNPLFRKAKAQSL